MPIKAALETLACPYASDLLRRVGDKWSVSTIILLESGTKRFNELLKASEGISQRILTLTLRNLERDGFVERVVISKSTLHVEYSLTALGSSLLILMGGVITWADQNRDLVKDARVKFDAIREDGFSSANK